MALPLLLQRQFSCKAAVVAGNMLEVCRRLQGCPAAARTIP
jgi:hypothetical protein